MIDRGLVLFMLVVAAIAAVLCSIGCLAFGWPWIVVVIVAPIAAVLAPVLLGLLFYLAWIASGSH